ncbi:MAG: monovalent cation/H+ antiporter complex subunit F [Phycisphaeraceae bacterium]
MQTLMLVLMAILVAAGVLAGYRVLRGPSLADRVVALEVAATLMVGLLALASIHAGDPVLLDVAMVVAVVSFIGTAAFARFLEKRSITPAALGKETRE